VEVSRTLAQGDQLNVEKKAHPPGEQGVRASLDAVSKRVAEGGLSPAMRRWSIEMLDKARKTGTNVHTPKNRAVVLLKAVQQKLWVPDPVGAEFIQGAHLTACTDPDKPCFDGGDCDDLVVLLGAAFLSVGINTLVVGHGYSSGGIRHVITAAHVDNKWHYADPSSYGPEGAHFPFGACAPFTRERIYSVPNIKVLCDDQRCIRDGSKFKPEANDFVTEGVFVGVDGVPFAQRFRWL
jgi:hypothetical protein